MRILIVNRGIFRVPPESSGGGAEKHGYYLANYLAMLGNEVHLVSKVSKGAKFNSTVILHLVPPSRGVIPPNTSLFGWFMKHLFGNILSTIVAMRVLAKSAKPFDIVHCHGALTALFLAKIVGSRVPVVYTMHDASPWIVSYSGAPERAFRKIAYLLIDIPCLKCVRQVIAVSPALAHEARRLGTPASRVAVVPNGVEIPLVEARKPAKLGRGQYGLFVGQLVPRKNVELIVEAAKRLGNLDVRFIVVGDGYARLSLMELARRLGVEEKVCFTGYVNDDVLANYFERAGFFVFPSLAEGLSLSLCEAMSYQLPAIAARLKVYEGLLQDGMNCLLFNPSVVAELEALIRRVYSDHDLATKIAKNGASMVRSRFSWEIVCKQVIAVYEEILTGTAREKSFNRLRLMA
jgi:glycosyltransferase involved in cell wall biosynthesis